MIINRRESFHGRNTQKQDESVWNFEFILSIHVWSPKLSLVVLFQRSGRKNCHYQLELDYPFDNYVIFERCVYRERKEEGEIEVEGQLQRECVSQSYVKPESNHLHTYRLSSLTLLQEYRLWVSIKCLDHQFSGLLDIRISWPHSRETSHDPDGSMAGARLLKASRDFTPPVVLQVRSGRMKAVRWTL